MNVGKRDWIVKSSGQMFSNVPLELNKRFVINVTNSERFLKRYLSDLLKCRKKFKEYTFLVYFRLICNEILGGSSINDF